MAGQGEPWPEWADACCGVCPAQTLGPGGFDVAARPFRGQAFRDGVRVDGATGVPTCVHPFRVGLPPGAYASAGTPIPELVDEDAEAGVRRRPIRALGRPLRMPREVFMPSPEQLVLPEQVEDLEGWVIAILRTASDAAMASALEKAEAIALEGGFTGEHIVTALRRVLASELSR